MSMTFKKNFYKIYEKVSKMLREYRERKKITQEKLADISGIDRKTILCELNSNISNIKSIFVLFFYFTKIK